MVLILVTIFPIAMAIVIALILSLWQEPRESKILQVKSKIPKMGDEGQDWKLGAALAAGLIGGAFIGWYASRGWQYNNHKYDRGDVGNNTSSEASEEIIREQLNRVECMYGEEGMKRFRGAFVIVVGLGGGAQERVRMFFFSSLFLKWSHSGKSCSSHVDALWCG